MKQAKREKFIKIVIWIIVVAFVTTIFATWDAHNYYERQHNPIAMVIDGEEITNQEFYRLYDRKMDELKKYYEEELSDTMILKVRNSVVDEFIEKILFKKLAKKYGVATTPRDIQSAVMRLFLDDKNQFNAQAFDYYKRTQSAMWWERLENSVKDDIILNKAHSLLTDKVKITDLELQYYFAAANMQANIQQIYLNPSLVIEAKAVEKYYNENKDLFIKPEKRWIKHIILNDTDVANDTPGNIKRIKINNIYEKLTSGANFDEIAATWSDEPIKYRDGKLYKNGDLGYLTKSDLFKDEDYAEQFIETAFSLKSGQISEPFRTEKGWHIVKVENIADTEYYSLKDKEEVIRWRLTSDTEINKTKELAKQIKAELDANKITFEEAVKKYSNGKSKKNNGKLGFIPRSDIPEDFWDDTQTKEIAEELPIENDYLDRNFSDSIFALALNTINEPIESHLGFHIIKVSEYKLPDQKEFDKQRSTIYQTLISMKARTIIDDWIKQEKKKIKIKYKFSEPDFLTRVIKNETE